MSEPDDDIGKQMQAFHAMRDLMTALHGPGCLENTPDGEEMRLPDAQTKPWEKLGISRATWYRQHKPKWEGQLASHSWSRQKQRALGYFCSTRTVQRQDFVRRYGIRELYNLASQSTLHRCLPLGMLEEIAKWWHEDQRRFIDRLVELARPLPTDGSDLKESIEYFGPVLGILLRVDDRTALKHVARQARLEIEIEIAKRVFAEDDFSPSNRRETL
jgi:hypothetical protein